MTPAQSRKVFAHLKHRISRFKRAYSHVPLNRHDWDDILQLIMIHISNKWHMWRGGSWKKWVNVISRNQFKNYCRDRATEFKRMGYHQSLYTRLTEDEVIVYEPDVVDESPDDLTRIYRALDLLPIEDQKIFDKMLEEGNWEATRGRMEHSRFWTYKRKQCAAVKELIEST